MERCGTRATEQRNPAGPLVGVLETKLPSLACACHEVIFFFFFFFLVLIEIICFRFSDKLIELSSDSGAF